MASRNSQPFPGSIQFCDDVDVQAEIRQRLKSGESSVTFELARFISRSAELECENAGSHNVVHCQDNEELWQRILQLVAELQRKEALLRIQAKRIQISLDLIENYFG